MGGNKHLIRSAQAALVIIIMTLTAGCASEPIINQNAGRAVKLETVKKGNIGFGFKTVDKPEYRVFRNKKDWAAFWKQSEQRTEGFGDSAGPEIAAGRPYVDTDPWSETLAPIGDPTFQHGDMAIGAFFNGSYGYEVNIFEIRKQKDKLLVKVELKAINPDKPGMSAPYHIVKIKEVDLPVKFLLKDERPRY